MRLSEAIRLGAMLRPQGFRNILAGGKTCAFGAAYDAIGIGAENIEPYKGVGYYVPHWHWTELFGVHCPVCQEEHCPAVIIASHLNDRHEWTRERIADWVATIEPKEESHVENDHAVSPRVEREDAQAECALSGLGSAS